MINTIKTIEDLGVFTASAQDMLIFAKSLLGPLHKDVSNLEAAIDATKAIVTEALSEKVALTTALTEPQQKATEQLKGCISKIRTAHKALTYLYQMLAAFQEVLNCNNTVTRNTLTEDEYTFLVTTLSNHTNNFSVDKGFMQLLVAIKSPHLQPMYPITSEILEKRLDNTLSWPTFIHQCVVHNNTFQFLFNQLANICNGSQKIDTVLANIIKEKRETNEKTVQSIIEKLEEIRGKLSPLFQLTMRLRMPIHEMILKSQSMIEAVTTHVKDLEKTKNELQTLLKTITSFTPIVENKKSITELDEKTSAFNKVKATQWEKSTMESLKKTITLLKSAENTILQMAANTNIKKATMDFMRELQEVTVDENTSSAFKEVKSHMSFLLQDDKKLLDIVNIRWDLVTIFKKENFSYNPEENQASALLCKYHRIYRELHVKHLSDLSVKLLDTLDEINQFLYQQSAKGMFSKSSTVELLIKGIQAKIEEQLKHFTYDSVGKSIAESTLSKNIFALIKEHSFDTTPNQPYTTSGSQLVMAIYKAYTPETLRVIQDNCHPDTDAKHLKDCLEKLYIFCEKRGTSSPSVEGDIVSRLLQSRDDLHAFFQVENSKSLSKGSGLTEPLSAIWLAFDSQFFDFINGDIEKDALGTKLFDIVFQHIKQRQFDTTPEKPYETRGSKLLLSLYHDHTPERLRKVQNALLNIDRFLAQEKRKSFLRKRTSVEPTLNAMRTVLQSNLHFMEETDCTALIKTQLEEAAEKTHFNLTQEVTQIGGSQLIKTIYQSFCSQQESTLEQTKPTITTAITPKQ